jgi:Domain of unknown function DUF11
MTLSLVLAAALSTSTAQAAAAPDLTTTITPPTTVDVDVAGTWTVAVNNVGNKNAANVSLVIQLPVTNTSPTVHIMGDLSGWSSTCSNVGSTITCSLGQVNKWTSKSRTFTIALPWSSEDIEVSATATTTTTESNTANNGDLEVANVIYQTVSVPAPATVSVNHCTGTNLTAYFECRLYPSSISSHSQDFLADGTLEFPLYGPEYGGTWTVTGTEMYFNITEYGITTAEFLGNGVGGGCYEGLTTFVGSSYVAPYEVCF